MNLHQIVSGAVSAVNPFITVTIQASAGYTTNADGSRSPAYAAPVSIQAQRQALQYNDLVQLDGLNITGTRCKLYLNGNWNGVVRPDQKGGDLITMPDGSVWLVAFVAENWSDVDGWASVVCTLQNGS
jgi:hypothetical protein